MTENARKHDIRFYQYQTEMEHELTPLEKKAGQIAWIDDKLHLHIAVSGYPTEVVMLNAIFDGIKLWLDENDIYAPADWLETEFPHLREVMKLIREKAEQVRYSEQ